MLMKKFVLPCFGIVVKVANGGGSIVSDLHQPPDPDDPDSWGYDAAMHAIEAIILAHAIAGIEVASPAYVEGVETAVATCANRF